MATFAKRSFDAAAYAAARPSYPPALLEHVATYLDRAPPASSSGPRTLVDLGCGPGLSTFDWLALNRFERIVGVDPSEGMVAAARDILKQRTAKGDVPNGVDVHFQVARADALAGVAEDASVDLAIAGQAAHWFDAAATYRELARVLKPGGAFAFWGYGEFFFPNRPELSTLIPSYSAGTLGQYWEQPGRSIVEALLTPFPLPSSSSSIPAETASAFDPSSLSRSFFLHPGSGAPPLGLPASLDPPLPTEPGQSASYTLPGLPQCHISRTLLLQRQWTRAQLEAYLRTWSAAHAFDEAHNPPRGGAQRERDPHGEEGERGTDVVRVFLKQLDEAGLGLGLEGGMEGETVRVAWEVGVVMGRKRHDSAP